MGRWGRGRRHAAGVAIGVGLRKVVGSVAACQQSPIVGNGLGAAPVDLKNRRTKTGAAIGESPRRARTSACNHIHTLPHAAQRPEVIGVGRGVGAGLQHYNRIGRYVHPRPYRNQIGATGISPDYSGSQPAGRRIARVVVVVDVDIVVRRAQDVVVLIEVQLNIGRVETSA